MIRPNLGSFAYLASSSLSWHKWIFFVMTLAVGNLYLLIRSKATIHLQHQRPQLYPSPIVVLPMPYQNILSREDACAIEILAKSFAPIDSKKKIFRTIYIYRWSSHVGPGEYYSQVLRELSNVKMFHLDIRKIISRYPFLGKISVNTWRALPYRIQWLVAGISLISPTGGVLTETGIAPTKDLQQILSDPYNHETPIIYVPKSSEHKYFLSLPTNNHILNTIVKALENLESTGFKSLESILTMLANHCQSSNATTIYNSICQNIIFLNSSEIRTFSDIQNGDSLIPFEDQTEVIKDFTLCPVVQNFCELEAL